MRRLILATILALALAGPGIVFQAQAKHTHPEKYYQGIWCAQHKGEVEHRLPDGTRVDCLTATHAVEHDFGHKWAESVGQALYYGLMTGRRAGVVLILEAPSDAKYVERVKAVVRHYRLPLDVWIMQGW